jgi:hypothetical protein
MEERQKQAKLTERKVKMAQKIDKQWEEHEVAQLIEQDKKTGAVLVNNIRRKCRTQTILINRWMISEIPTSKSYNRKC